VVCEGLELGSVDIVVGSSADKTTRLAGSGLAKSTATSLSCQQPSAEPNVSKPGARVCNDMSKLLQRHVAHAHRSESGYDRART